MKTADENIKFMGMVLLKWGFYLALSPNYLELGIMLKICWVPIDIYEGPYYKITPHESIRVHEYCQKDHSIWSKHFLIVYVHVLNKWWNLSDGSQVFLCPNIWRASLSSGANLHKKWRILFASFRYVKTKIAPFA